MDSTRCGAGSSKNVITSDNTVASDQIIRYPPVGGASKYTFSLWGISSRHISIGSSVLFSVLPAILSAERLSGEYAVRRLLGHEGPKLAAFLFV